MNKILLLFLIGFTLSSCNEYEVPQPMVRVNIHVMDQDDGTAFIGYEGTLRSSDFSLVNTSFFFSENSESVRLDSGISNENGDFAFDIPFVDGVPQSYYELSLSKNSEITPVTEGRFLNQYMQFDTIRVGGLTQLDVKVRNDSCRTISFSTLGYQTQEDYRRDSADTWRFPDYIARFERTTAKDTILSKTLPIDCNKYMVLQVIDNGVFPPLLIQFDVFEMERDSILVHCVNI